MAGRASLRISAKLAWCQPNSIQGISCLTRKQKKRVPKMLKPAKTSAAALAPSPRMTGIDHAGEGDEDEGALEHGAVGVAADAAIGGLEELLELAEEDGDSEVEDDPLGVDLVDVGEAEDAGDGEEVEGAGEEQDGRRADAYDEPPAALEDAEGAGTVVAGYHHGHFVAGYGSEAYVGEA